MTPQDVKLFCATTICHFFVPPQFVTFFCATTICRTSSNMATKCYNVKKRDILRCSRFCCVFCATTICHFFCATAICNFFWATTICQTSSNMVTLCYNVKKRNILRCSHFCCCVFCATAICHIFLRHHNLSHFIQNGRKVLQTKKV